ncbi:hypothetical protein ABEL47_01615 [Escherichia coli]
MSEIDMMFPGSKAEPKEAKEVSDKKAGDHAQKLHQTKIKLAAIFLMANHAGHATGRIKPKGKPQASQKEKKPVALDKAALRG